MGLSADQQQYPMKIIREFWKLAESPKWVQVRVNVDIIDIDIIDIDIIDIIRKTWKLTKLFQNGSKCGPTAISH